MNELCSKLILSNPLRPDLGTMEFEAVFDARALNLRLPASVAESLGLGTLDQKQLCFADGTFQTVPYAGPVLMNYGGNLGFTGAVIYGDQVILGTIPMDEMRPGRA